MRCVNLQGTNNGNYKGKCGIDVSEYTCIYFFLRKRKKGLIPFSG